MKKITTLVLSLVLVLAMSITAFAATNNDVLGALKGHVSGDVYGQVEAFLSENKLTEAELTAVKGYVDAAVKEANGVTDVTKLTAEQKKNIKNDILAAAGEIKSVKVDVNFDAASNSVVVKAGDKTYTAKANAVQATGVSTTATVAGIAVLAMGLVACGVAVSKKRFA